MEIKILASICSVNKFIFRMTLVLLNFSISLVTFSILTFRWNNKLQIWVMTLFSWYLHFHIKSNEEWSQWRWRLKKKKKWSVRKHKKQFSNIYWIISLRNIIILVKWRSRSFRENLNFLTQSQLTQLRHRSFDGISNSTVYIFMNLWCIVTLKLQVLERWN